MVRFLCRFARDNVYNFIKFCRMLEVMEVVMFETEDLVSQEQTQHLATLFYKQLRGNSNI
jgi:hypothetical protein